MILAAAQTQPFTGNISSNIQRHLTFIDEAAKHKVEWLLFPELSLTGYEPTLAETLAMDWDDPRFQAFEAAALQHQMTIGVGFPLRSSKGIQIAMAIFQPGKNIRSYIKKYLHQDELPYFVEGQNHEPLIEGHPEISFAICYEISVPEHVHLAHNRGSSLYLASVAKFTDGVQKAHKRLAEISKDFQMTVLMANSIGPADNGMCTGQSAAWVPGGKLLGQLDDCTEGLLILDTEKGKAHTQYLSI